jgi:hypothetical protein
MISGRSDAETPRSQRSEAGLSQGGGAIGIRGTEGDRLMPRPQEVRPGAKVPRSGIYQDRLSQRRATLVKGEPAPPTPGKASRWQQVVDTASAPAPRARPWTLLSGVVLGAGLMLWVRSAPTGHEPWPHTTARSRSGGVLAFCAGVVAGHCLTSVSSPGRLGSGRPRAWSP